MRLSDLLWRKAEQEKQPAEGTRTVDMTSAELVKEMRMDNTRAKEKLDAIPKETVEELRPFFSADFFGKPGEA